MKTIELTRGKFALVDDTDYEWVSRYKWYAHPHGTNKRLYAARNETIGYKTRRTILMHRLILSAKDGEEVDHANGNTLDNTRKNIRICTHSDNMINKEYRPTTHRLRGVKKRKYPKNRPWEARISISGQLVSLGYFDSEESAAAAYNSAALRHHGKFARPNKFNEEGTATRG